MLVVLDTNVLFSALLTPHGISHEIYRAWRSNRFELVTSTMQLDEIRRASRYPKFKSVLHPALIGTLVNNMRHTLVLEHLTLEEETDDPE
jgi:putative PIN family toxin of toxin-antitoxin system